MKYVKDNQIPFHQKHEVLYGFIIFLLILLLFILISNKHAARKDAYINDMRDVRYQFIENPIPEAVPKSKDISSIEEKLKIKRTIDVNKDGLITIKASVSGVKSIAGDLVINDFVDEIKLGKAVKLTEGKLNPKRGTVFPPGKNLTISTYGVGARDQKPVRINVTLVDVDLSSNNANEEVLYELFFKPSRELEQIIFDGAELRSDLNIIKLEQEISDL